LTGPYRGQHSLLESGRVFTPFRRLSNTPPPFFSNLRDNLAPPVCEVRHSLVCAPRWLPFTNRVRLSQIFSFQLAAFFFTPLHFRPKGWPAVLLKQFPLSPPRSGDRVSRRFTPSPFVFQDPPPAFRRFEDRVLSRFRSSLRARHNDQHENRSELHSVPWTSF